MKYLIGLCLLLVTSFARGNNYSYIYIEGDKQTPFYVKMEGQMLPRLGKNYCIIPNLDAGVMNIEILFQQNSYPAQKFALNIPAAGRRGFVLQKVNDRQFALYDLQQGNYIVSGNKPEEDKLPENNDAAVVVDNTADVKGEPVTAATDPEDLPAFTPAKNKKKTPAAKQAKSEEQQQADSRFISDLELNTGKGQPVAKTVEAVPAFEGQTTPAPAPKKKKKPKREVDPDLPAIRDEEDGQDHRVTADKPKAAPVAEEPAGIPNSDCRTAMSNDEFENFALKILDEDADDDAKIKILTKNKKKNCFSTEQVRILANNLVTQSGRYDVVKMLYPQTSDQANYGKLESLFKTNFLKEKFRAIIGQ
ncbi:DUF4476 domain-containing protein [Taibaiella chishuiensis]|uniref:Uncharacterized protein DUF4476 n=1 Tax=Taibaiella chishuiensis TaxID=1434707 RepID=A0A2P8D5M5_9BACT|nr:DUF4476 domain-containing protein [Taibaiella chishuiensis]PSK92523.1 uncharacterized protein DUF4476 [Taibaiella chishuiensis]